LSCVVHLHYSSRSAALRRLDINFGGDVMFDHAIPQLEMDTRTTARVLTECK